jgi:hypothetical protein
MFAERNKVKITSMASNEEIWLDYFSETSETYWFPHIHPGNSIMSLPVKLAQTR